MATAIFAAMPRPSPGRPWRPIDRNGPSTQAPMVPVTHYMDRSGQVLAEVSPRRFFCTACHVPQYPVDPTVENTFIDTDTLLRQVLEAE
ncbi:hypothetical protein FHG66_13545 [Rubellimicrobium rubrum]|uniref:Periplasmic nitrate reductase, electron transfer subunit n=2 Tax=Rubellimicrobium rubrum TaxID=2585369 RepID=A0A5C4MSM2_9RHOB|nr:hypothetical protein FHG66_13545 [Rubellimicrobium rubrum]